MLLFQKYFQVLHCTSSELEVLNAVGAWLNHNFDERKTFASNLLLKVRFCLFSENSLKCFLRERLALKRDNTCVILVQKMLKGEIKCNQSNFDVRYRYCDQNMFGIHMFVEEILVFVVQEMYEKLMVET